MQFSHPYINKFSAVLRCYQYLYAKSFYLSDSMKNLILTISTLLCFGLVHAQDADNTQKAKKTDATQKPVCYIGFGGGLNNPCGIFGFDFNIALAPHVTLDAGAGTSTWGNKLYVGSKYYLDEPQRGWAFGGGLTFNSGIENMKLKDMETVNGKREVILNLKPQTNIYVAASKYWKLGRRNNRFFLTMGYSVPMKTVKYQQTFGPELTDTGERVIKTLAPGGLMFGWGFSFALYNKHSS